jgi:hypothetical protein
VAFASDNPGMAHLLLRPEMAALDAHPSANEPGARSIALLREVVVACQRDGCAPKGDPGVVVAMVWALVVGFVGLWLDGPIATRCAELDRTPTELSQQVIALLQSLLRS